MHQLSLKYLKEIITRLFILYSPTNKKKINNHSYQNYKNMKNNSHTYGRSYGHQKLTFSKIIKTK